MKLDLRNLLFQLAQNDEGHASQATLMTFDNSIDPLKATYSGPNVLYGHVIVQDNIMLYQSLNADKNLSAGEALITLDSEVSPTIMTLNWRWLTGDLSNGISIWHKISPNKVQKGRY